MGGLLFLGQDHLNRAVHVAQFVLAPTAWLVGTDATYRRRRLLVSSWRRAMRWEYWPPWITYAPVVVYVLWLMARHRSVTAFTAANPAIPAGGVVGESKSEILRGLGPGAPVAATACLPGGLSLEEKRARVDRFMRQHHLALPVVVKPDAGQRGSGVVVARTSSELTTALAASPVDTVVQEYVGGEEFGVFYVRRPSEPTGHILSITRKHLPTVWGDGRRTLDRLILDDDRALCMARFHLARQRERLGYVARAGERVSLGDCGSHCRGALFLDGSALWSPALAAAIDRTARALPGFYFGRFDLRAPSAAALSEGRDFTVLELNGVTSEATHIYDPAVGVFEAYRVLFEQWRLAFEIGGENVSRGARTTSLLGLASLARQYYRDAHHHLDG